MDSNWFSHSDISVTEQTPVTFTVYEFGLGFDEFFPFGVFRDFEFFVNRFFVTIGNRFARIVFKSFFGEVIFIIIESASKTIIVVATKITKTVIIPTVI